MNQRAGILRRMADGLVVRGAREHNLRDVSLDLPRDRLIVFTGLSGSGKSSLAFDTISPRASAATSSPSRRTPASSWARWTSPTSTSSRGCRRPSPSTRSRPPVTPLDRRDDHRGLRLPAAPLRPDRSPALPRCAGGQWPARRPSRSSTGCSNCRGDPVPGPGARGPGPKGGIQHAARRPGQAGFRPGPRRRGALELAERADVNLARYEIHTIEVVVDRLIRRDNIRQRLTESIETALELTGGTAEVLVMNRRRGRGGGRGDHLLPAPVVHALRHQLRGARAPQLLLQLAVRGLPDLPRPGHQVRGRPRAGRAR